MKHEFHFILNEELYSKLLKLSKSINKNLSKTVVLIFDNLNSFAERNHLTSREKESRYKTLAGPEEKRYHVHCYLPEYLYRKLKLIHHDLNTYSLAQIIREMIDNFLKGCSKYGNKDFMERLGIIKKIWDKKKLIYRKTKRKFLRQVSYKSNHLPYCITTYGNDFQPYLIQLV
jgi:hypothetical protein